MTAPNWDSMLRKHNPSKSFNPVDGLLKDSHIQANNPSPFEIHDEIAAVLSATIELNGDHHSQLLPHSPISAYIEFRFSPSADDSTGQGFVPSPVIALLNSRGLELRDKVLAMDRYFEGRDDRFRKAFPNPAFDQTHTAWLHLAILVGQPEILYPDFLTTVYGPGRYAVFGHVFQTLHFASPLHFNDRHLGQYPLMYLSRQSKLSSDELNQLQKDTHFDKKELQQWYKGLFDA